MGVPRLIRKVSPDTRADLMWLGAAFIVAAVAARFGWQIATAVAGATLIAYGILLVDDGRPTTPSRRTFGGRR